MEYGQPRSIKASDNWALLPPAAGVGKNSTRSSEREQGDRDARKHSDRRQLEFKPNWVVI